jgi:hypothetical protein
MNDTIFASYNNVMHYNIINPMLLNNQKYSKDSLDYTIENLENLVKHYKDIRQRLENE